MRPVRGACCGERAAASAWWELRGCTPLLRCTHLEHVGVVPPVGVKTKNGGSGNASWWCGVVVAHTTAAALSDTSPRRQGHDQEHTTGNDATLAGGKGQGGVCMQQCRVVLLTHVNTTAAHLCADQW